MAIAPHWNETTSTLRSVPTVGRSWGVSLNDFTDLGSNNDGLIVDGDAGALLDLRRNYWGTTVPSEIEAKILHRIDDVARPLVVFEPLLLQPNPIPEYVPISLSVPDQPLVAGSTISVDFNIANVSGFGNAMEQSAALFYVNVNDSRLENRRIPVSDVQSTLCDK